MNEKDMSIPEIRIAGMEALRDRLGIAGMIKFLSLYDPGEGDYTLERHKWLDKLTLDEVVNGIRKRRDK